MKDNGLLFSEQLLLTFEVTTFVSEDEFWDVIIVWYPHFRGTCYLPKLWLIK